MRLPNKIFSYSNSIFPMMVFVASRLKNQDMRVVDLYHNLSPHSDGIVDLFSALDAMYALGVVTFDSKQGGGALCWLKLVVISLLTLGRFAPQ